MRKSILYIVLSLLPLLSFAAGYDRAKALSALAMGKGELLVAATVVEGNAPDVLVMLSGREDGKAWQVSEPLAGLSGIQAAVLWKNDKGTVTVFVSCSDGQWYAAEWTGKAFTQPLLQGKGRCVSAPVCLQDRRRVLPMFLPGEGVCLYEAGENGVWTALSAPVAVPAKVSDRDDDPYLVETDGELRLYVRTCGTGFAYVLSSTDGGRSWSEPVKAFENPDQDFAMCALPNGKTLLVKNAKIDNHVYLQRRGLYAYLSEDGGRLWWGGLCLDAGMKPSDPKIALSEDGKVYIVYTLDAMEESVIRLVTTSYAEVDASSPWACKNASSVKNVWTAPGAAKRMADELAVLKAPKKNWADKTLRVATYNIQYPTPVFPWEKRIEPLIKLIKQYKFDVFGSQEPFLPQIEDMMARIGDEYDWVGTCINGDNNSRDKHFCPIFYRKDRVELLETETVYYSETPKTAGFDAYSPRHCIWAKFRDKLTGKEFYIFNSHFDHIGREAVELSAEILVETVKRVAGGMPAFMTGDFNTNEDSETYRTIVSCGFISDSMLAVANAVNSEYFSMSHYKPIETVKKEGKHIDHIFYTPNSSKVLSWKLILDSYDGAFGSDHLPIMIEWKIAN